MSRKLHPTVSDIRAMKARCQKISMLYVTTHEEAAAADAASVQMLSIEAKYFTPNCARLQAGASYRLVCHSDRMVIL